MSQKHFKLRKDLSIQVNGKTLYKRDGYDNGYTDIELNYLYTSIKNGLKLIKALNKSNKGS